MIFYCYFLNLGKVVMAVGLLYCLFKVPNDDDAQGNTVPGKYFEAMARNKAQQEFDCD
jgi:hypothetical protein